MALVSFSLKAQDTPQKHQPNARPFYGYSFVDKGNDYSQLYDLVRQKVKVIVAMGVDNAPIHAAFDDMIKVVDVRSMAECSATCRSLASAGDTVLLSPPDDAELTT